MPDGTTFGLFFVAALILALTLGPGILYVLARSLGGGTATGITSTGGIAIGGFGHVFAAALGLSALLATSASAFTIVKLAGAAYLIVLGMRTLLAREDATIATGAAHDGKGRAFWQEIVTELLNPKTALFFLAFVPQFITPGDRTFAQFIALGTVAVLLNTSVDLLRRAPGRADRRAAAPQPALTPGSAILLQRRPDRARCLGGGGRQERLASRIAEGTVR